MKKNYVVLLLVFAFCFAANVQSKSVRMAPNALNTSLGRQMFQVLMGRPLKGPLSVEDIRSFESKVSIIREANPTLAEEINFEMKKAERNGLGSIHAPTLLRNLPVELAKLSLKDIPFDSDNYYIQEVLKFLKHSSNSEYNAMAKSVDKGELFIISPKMVSHAIKLSKYSEDQIIDFFAVEFPEYEFFPILVELPEYKFPLEEKISILTTFEGYGRFGRMLITLEEKRHNRNIVNGCVMAGVLLGVSFSLSMCSN